MKHAYYGDELDRLNEGGSFTNETLRQLAPEFRSISDRDLTTVNHVLNQHFVHREGVFGGQITAGDGYFIGLFMAAMRPASMIEVGVASGYSSALILSLAEALGLTKNQPFLVSFDLMETHNGGNVTGSLMREQFAHLLPLWKLTTQQTTATLSGIDLPAGSCMAFLDGGHNHPWPAIDLAFLEKNVPQCKWALMQDVQMMERWVADAVIYQAVVPSPVRGVQFAVNHWPGRKVLGNGLCYNMAAVELGIGERLQAFISDMKLYPFEIYGEQAALCEAALIRLADTARA